MWFRSVRDLPPRRSTKSGRRPLPFRPRVEALEDRCLLTLNPAVNYAVAASPLDVAVGDFTGDGVADLATINATQLSLLLGNGNGTFPAAQTTTAGTGLRSVAAGHFNADTLLDLAITSSVTTWNGSTYVTEGFVNVLLNNGTDGTGNVTFETRTFSTGTNTTPGAIAVGDLNDDGKLDVAAAQAGGSNVTVLMGNGDGNLQAGGDVAVGANPVSVALGDFNRDNRLDIATANQWSSSISLLMNNGNDPAGNATFQDARHTSLNGPVGAVAVGDFDANGKLDLAATSTITYWGYYYYSTNSYVNVLLGNGDGTFAAPKTTWANNTHQADVAVADFNDDGKLDVVTSDGLQVIRVDPTVLLGWGDGTFDTPYHFDAGTGPVAVAAADFNGDTAPDVGVANFYSANVSVLTNDQNWPPLGAPFVSIGDVYLTEGNTGTSAAVFTVSLSAPFNGPISVDYTTADGTATAGSDYQATSGTLTFSPGGPLTQTVSVPVLGDRLAEQRYYSSYEYFFVNLSNPSNVRVADGQGAGFIADNEPLITVSNPQVTEGNTGTTNAAFSVTMATSSSGPVSVTWSTADGTATAGSDYQATSGTLTFNPGAPLTQTVSVPVIGDRLGEYESESFYVTLGNGYSGYATIVEDEPLVSIDEMTTVTEGNTGTTAAVFTVRLSQAYDEPVSVNFSTAEGDTQAWYGWSYYGYYPPPPPATAGSDFQAQSGTVTIAAGRTSETISVAVIGDRLAEPTEYFSVDLTDASPNASRYYTHALGVINDNEPAITIDAAPTVMEGNTGTTTAVFTVRLSAASSGPVSVTWSTADGSATAGSDYQETSGTLTFNPGAPLTQTVSVTVLGDRLGEYSEYFYLNLGNGQSGYGTIVDDEPRISISDTWVVEGNTGTTTAVFTVSLAEAYDEPVSVNFSVAEGDTEAWYGWGYYGYYYPPPAATAGSDFQPQGGTVTFDAGQTSQEIHVVVNGDRLVETEEYFSVNLSNTPANAFLSDGHGLGGIADDEPRISISDVTVTEGNNGTTTATFTVSLSALSDEPVSVQFVTTGGDTYWPSWYGDRPAATAGDDFESQSGPITIAAGQPSATISVTVNGDTLVEEDEYFSVDLTSPTANATVSDGHAVGIIADDDQPPTKFYVVDASSDRTFEYDPTGEEVENYGLGSGNNAPRGAASDASGERVWVIDNDDYVYVYDAAGQPLGSWKARGLSTPEGIASDGTDIWIVDRGRDRVYRYAGGANRTSGSANPSSSFALNSGNRDAKGIEIDGTHLWVVNDASTNKVFQYTLTGTLRGSWTISGANKRPTGITLDPSNPSDVWIVDAGRDQVFQYTAAAGRTSGSQSASAVFNLAAGNTSPQGIADPPVAAGADLEGFPVALPATASPPVSTRTLGEAIENDGWSGPTSFPFTESLPVPSTEAVTVRFRTTDGATARHDSAAASDILPFALGEDIESIAFLLDGDTMKENDESFSLNPIDGCDAVFADAEGLATILQDARRFSRGGPYVRGM